MTPTSPSSHEFPPPLKAAMETSYDGHANKAEFPPTPESVIPQLSSSPVGPSLAHIYSSSLGELPAKYAPSSSPSGPSSAYIMSSTPATDFETPRGKRTISNRFWDKNSSRSSAHGPGVDLASDTSDGDDDEQDPAVARAMQLRALDARIKRLLVLETGPGHNTTLSSNPIVKTYDALLSAFAHKPRTKKKREKATTALLEFLQDHAQIVEFYNAFAQLENNGPSDRVLPEFSVEDENEDSNSSPDSDSKNNLKAKPPTDEQGVRRAPAKHALNDDESDEEGIVTQTVRVGEDFGEESVFNTRGVGAPSIFGKSSARKEKNQRRFLLHKREGEMGAGTVERKRAAEMDVTPTREGKRRRVE